MTRRGWFAIPVLAVLALTLAACGGGGSGSSSGGGAVDVALQEYAIIPAQDSIGAGEVTFNVTNEGPKETHEFVVVRTDLAADALPASADGSADEESSEIESVGEIEDMAVGDTQSVKFDLAAGSYVFICNIVEGHGSETHVHYKLGMRTAFTVT